MLFLFIFFMIKLNKLQCQRVQILSQAAFCYAGEIDSLSAGKNVTSELLLKEKHSSGKLQTRPHCFIELCVKADPRLTDKVLQSVGRLLKCWH